MLGEDGSDPYRGGGEQGSSQFFTEASNVNVSKMSNVHSGRDATTNYFDGGIHYHYPPSPCNHNPVIAVAAGAAGGALSAGLFGTPGHT